MKRPTQINNKKINEYIINKTIQGDRKTIIQL
jgi:hypothetical protein